MPCAPATEYKDVLSASYARSVLLLAGGLAAIYVRWRHRSKRLTLRVWTADPELCANLPEHFGFSGEKKEAELKIRAVTDLAELHYILGKVRKDALTSRSAVGCQLPRERPYRFRSRNWRCGAEPQNLTRLYCLSADERLCTQSRGQR